MEVALERYYQHFGESYPLLITSTRTDEEVIDRINHCIETNQPEAEPEYEDGVDY